MTAIGTHPTNGQARAFAAAVILHAGDIPHFGTTYKFAFGPDTMSLALCVGTAADGPSIADMAGQDFGLLPLGSGGEVSSSVRIMPDSRRAAQYLAAAASAKGRRCVARYLYRALTSPSPSGVSYREPRSAKVAAPANTSGPSFGYRFTIRATEAGSGGGAAVWGYVDFFGFQAGVAVILLQTESSPAPFPLAAERQLYSLLARRAGVA